MSLWSVTSSIDTVALQTKAWNIAQQYENKDWGLRACQKIKKIIEWNLYALRKCGHWYFTIHSYRPSIFNLWHLIKWHLVVMVLHNVKSKFSTWLDQPLNPGNSAGNISWNHCTCSNKRSAVFHHLSIVDSQHGTAPGRKWP